MRSLRGTDGSRDVIVNSHGKEVGPARPGARDPFKDLRLTIDLDLQRVAGSRLMEGNRKRALVAMDPHTGEILAMSLALTPTIPTQFCRPPAPRPTGNQIITDPNHPLMNKACIQAQLACPARPSRSSLRRWPGPKKRRPGRHANCTRRRELLCDISSLRQTTMAWWISTIAIPLLSADTFCYTLA